MARHLLPESRSIIALNDDSPSMPSSVSGRGKVIASRIWASRIAFMLFASPRVTRPAPTRMADMAVIAAAPVFPGDPASNKR